MVSTLLPNKNLTLLPEKECIISGLAGSPNRGRRHSKPLVALKSLVGPLSLDENTFVIKPSLKHEKQFYSNVKYSSKPGNPQQMNDGRVCPIKESLERSPVKGNRQPILFPSLGHKKEQGQLKPAISDSQSLTARDIIESTNKDQQVSHKLHPSGAETFRPNEISKTVQILAQMQQKALPPHRENSNEQSALVENDQTSAPKVPVTERSHPKKAAHQNQDNTNSNTSATAPNTNNSSQVTHLGNEDAQKAATKSKKESAAQNSTQHNENVNHGVTGTPDSSSKPPASKKPALCDMCGNMLPLTPLSMVSYLP